MTTSKQPKHNPRSKFKFIVAKDEDHPLAGREIQMYERGTTGNLVDCPGEAHSNAFIDHCGLCAPRWGKVEEVAPLDMGEVRASGMAISCHDLTRDQCKIEESHGAVLVSIQKARRKPGSMCMSFCAYVYPNLKAVD